MDAMTGHEVSLQVRLSGDQVVDLHLSPGALSCKCSCCGAWDDGHVGGL